MKGLVEVLTTYDVEIPDEAIERVMSPEWQEQFYRFRDRHEAIAWLAVNINGTEDLQNIDGFADREWEASSVSKGSVCYGVSES